MSGISINGDVQSNSSMVGSVQPSNEKDGLEQRIRESNGTVQPIGEKETSVQPIGEKDSLVQSSIDSIFSNVSKSINQDLDNIKSTAELKNAKEMLMEESVKGGLETEAEGLEEEAGRLEDDDEEHSEALTERKKIVIIVIVSSSGILCLLLISFCYIKKVTHTLLILKIYNFRSRRSKDLRIYALLEILA